MNMFRRGSKYVSGTTHSSNIISFENKSNEMKSFDKFNRTGNTDNSKFEINKSEINPGFDGSNIDNTNLNGDVSSDLNNSGIIHGAINAESQDTDTTRIVKQINVELSRVEKNLEALEGLKNNAIDRLEEQKHELRDKLSKGIAPETNLNDLIKSMHTMEEEEKEFLMKDFVKADGSRLVTGQVITEVIHELDMEISRLQETFLERRITLEERRDELVNATHSLQRLELMKQAIELKILEVQEEYASLMESMLFEQSAVEGNDKLTNEQKNAALELIRESIKNKSTEFNETVTNLRQQIESLDRESKEQQEAIVEQLSLHCSTGNITGNKKKYKVSSANSKLNQIKNNITELEEQIAQLEREKYRVPTETKRLNEKIQELIVELAELKRVHSLEYLNEYLASKGISITIDGALRSMGGRFLTVQEAQEHGLLENVPMEEINALIEHEMEKARAEQGDSDTSSSIHSLMSSSDVEYLKQVVGKPLTLALAEVATRQPKDPINYIAHWLIKYRYNQEVDFVQKKEIDLLSEQRDKLVKEKLHKMLEVEAREAILRIIANVNMQGGEEDQENDEGDYEDEGL